MTTTTNVQKTLRLKFTPGSHYESPTAHRHTKIPDEETP
jgi:hypothetical protein